MLHTHKLFVIALLCMIVISSFGVVITRHYMRMAFMQSEELLKRQDELQIRWESLQLERSALRSEGRIEALAENELSMKTPQRDEIVTLIVKGTAGD